MKTLSSAEAAVAGEIAHNHVASKRARPAAVRSSVEPRSRLRMTRAMLTGALPAHVADLPHILLCPAISGYQWGGSWIRCFPLFQTLPVTGLTMTRPGPRRNRTISYRDSGVDIDAGNALVEAIKPLVKTTRRPGAEADLGG